MRRIIFILFSVIAFSCLNNDCRVTRIKPCGSIKTVEVQWGDSSISDTSFTVSSAVPDTEILKKLQIIEDSLRHEKSK